MSHLTTREVRDLGVMLEVNRKLLHPRGLALQGVIQLDGTPVHTLVFYREGIEKLLELTAWMRKKLDETSPEDSQEWQKWFDDLDERLVEALNQPDVGWLRIRDGRDDPEGFYFDDLDEEDIEKAKRFDYLHLERAVNRKAELGFDVQPLEVTQK